MYNRGKDGQPKGFGFGGFSMKSASSSSTSNNPLRKGTSVETHLAQIGFGMPGSMAPSRGYGGGSNIGKRRVKSEEE